MDTERWLVVGLGNPEADYGGTRHNIGADVVRGLADRLGERLKPHKKVKAQLAEARQGPGGALLTLLVPFGYMNTSGGPVQQAMAFFSLEHDRLVVVHDDLDLDLGVVRLKRGGGDGGHKGLDDIRRRTGGGDYCRVRVGIGRPPGRMDPADYVLKPFAKHERDEAALAVQRAGDAVLDLIGEGLEAAQNRHHQRPA